MTVIPDLALQFSMIVLYQSGTNKLTCFIHFTYHLPYFLVCITETKNGY